MGMKRIVRSKEEGEEGWNWITGFIHRKDDEFPKIMSRKISKKRQETRNYDKERNSMILEFQKFGFSSRRGVQAWVEKEIEELAQRMNENSITVTRTSPTRTDISRNSNRKPSAKNKSSQLKLNASPVDVPQHIGNAIQDIGGTPPVWLGSKVLTHSDINAQLGRLLFPRCCDAGVYKTMTSDEKENVEVVDQVGGLDAKLIDPKGEVWDVEFKHWNSLNGFTGKNWNRLVKENSWNIKADVIHIWIFRSSPIAQLSFAIYTTPRMNICN